MVLIGDECFACWDFDGFQQIEDGTCIEVCGDGIFHNIDHECDDGNSEDGDGCTSECAVEYGFACPGGKNCHEVISPTALVAEVREPNIVIMEFDEEVYTTSEGKPVHLNE